MTAEERATEREAVTAEMRRLFYAWAAGQEWNSDQTRPEVRLRHSLMRRARAEGFTASEIARATGRHHSTVAYALREGGWNA